MAILKSAAFRKIFLAGAISVALIMAIPVVQAETMKMDEKKVQAGLLYNFLKYTTWPQAVGDLNVCLLGGDSFSGNLFPLEGRTAQQSQIRIKIVHSLREASICNAVYVHESKTESITQIIDALKDKNILTLSDIRHFSDLGGMVEFAKGKDERIHLHINREAVDNGGLQISSRLLNLAELGRDE